VSHRPNIGPTPPPPPPRAGPGRAALALAGLAAAALLLWLVCGRTPSDEDRVRAVIDEVEEAAEARDVSGIMEHVSERFKDADGLGKRELRGILISRFLGSKESVAIQRAGATTVQLRGPKSARTGATASFRARISDRGAIGAALEREGWDFEVELAKEGGDWRVTTYRRALAP
jgi:hypothetical protein